jgi:uncharacterized protein YheU (UPF0270 family)
MLQVPPDRLSSNVLDALIEEFVTRHGTNLSDAAAKAAQVRAQLKAGHVIIVYDEKTDSTNIVPKGAKEEPIRDTRARSGKPQNNNDREIIYDEPEPPDPTDY